MKINIIEISSPKRIAIAVKKVDDFVTSAGFDVFFNIGL